MGYDLLGGAFPPIAQGYYPTDAMSMLPQSMTGSLPSSGGGVDFLKLAGLGQMGMGMMNQQQQQGAMPQSGVVPARERLNMQEWMRRYGLLA